MIAGLPPPTNQRTRKQCMNHLEAPAYGPCNRWLLPGLKRNILKYFYSVLRAIWILYKATVVLMPHDRRDSLLYTAVGNKSLEGRDVLRRPKCFERKRARVWDEWQHNVRITSRDCISGYDAHMLMLNSKMRAGFMKMFQTISLKDLVLLGYYNRVLYKVILQEVVKSVIISPNACPWKNESLRSFRRNFLKNSTSLIISLPKVW